MDNYLIDRETLGQFVDELIKKKPLPVNTPEELNALREDSIKSLDDQIGDAIFGKLSTTENATLSQLLQREEVTEENLQDFFNGVGLDVEQTIADAMKSFGEAFIGGQNV